MWEQIIASALHIAELAMEGQTPNQRAEFWQMYLDDIKELRAFIREHKVVVTNDKLARGENKSRTIQSNKGANRTHGKG